MDDKCLCPICFTLYPIVELQSDWPTCPDCGSEAITVELESIAVFFEKHSLAELELQLASWLNLEGFRESYRQAKAARMQTVIEMKRSVT